MDRHCDISKRPKEISEANWKILKGLYKHVNDIDLFTAGLAETPVKGGVTGPTFSCIKGLQFEALREGDRCDEKDKPQHQKHLTIHVPSRFFFTHEEGTTPGSLSKPELKNIRSRRLKDILCDNTAIPQAQPNVFLNESPTNKVSTCEEDFNELNVQLFV